MPPSLLRSLASRRLIAGFATSLLCAASAGASPHSPGPPRATPEHWVQAIRPDGSTAWLGRCATPHAHDETGALPFAPLAFPDPVDCGSSTNPLAGYAPGNAYLVEVWVHILQHSNGDGNVPIERVASQLDVLNEDFGALAGTPGGSGTDVALYFRLAGVTRTTNDFWFNDDPDPVLGWYFAQLAVDPTRFLNLYTNSAGGNLGYVPFLPHTFPSGVGTADDRVVIHWEAFGRPAPFAPYDLGRTATHEVGHYFGLLHPFAGACASASAPACYSDGDRICDTPPESSPAGGCPVGRDSCPGGGLDPIENYMDYSDDLCMTRFSDEQMRRMRCTIMTRRTLIARPVLFLDGYEIGTAAAWSAVSP